MNECTFLGKMLRLGVAVGRHRCVNYLVCDDALAGFAADVMGEPLPKRRPRR
jgi:hypothetical protein